MKAFHTIAVPHKDILEGRLTMDVFAADLWEVFKSRGPEEYRDPDLFFRKTFLTKGLGHLLNAVQERTGGRGGESVIQLQTPFGGGKTHALISIFHKAKEWNVNTFVFVGDKLGPQDTVMWENLEEQLTGEINKLAGRTVPSGENLRKVLEKKEPLILLIDELIEYLIPARGLTVGKTSFDSQVLSFIKRLTEVVSSLTRTVLLVTSPSRTQYSTEDQILLDLLMERLGRIEKSLTPVEDYEITKVVRKRLFSQINESEARNTVSESVEYFAEQKLLPLGVEASEYREKFLESYPFLPDVITDCLYYRWGSYPSFQRTRGVLRLLSLLIYTLRNENISYIALGDLNFRSQDIRRELLKHIGNEYDSVIEADITAPNSNSKKAELDLADSYKGLKLGPRIATTVFLYSFSGGEEIGASLNEIKRSATFTSIPANVIDTVLDNLHKYTHYMREKAGKHFFSNKPNLNRVHQAKIENIDEKTVVPEIEKKYLSSLVKKGKLKTYIWPRNPGEITDNIDLKLVILKKFGFKLMKSIIDAKGVNLESPRVNKNTIFFLSPKTESKAFVISSIKSKIAWEQILADSSLKLTDEEKKDIKKTIKEHEEAIRTNILSAYSNLYVPSKDAFSELDLGIPTFGSDHSLIEEAYQLLKDDYILDKLAPLALKVKYLQKNKLILTKQLLESSYKTLGETRFINKKVLEDGIKEGVKIGVFGLGELEGDQIKPIYWKAKSSVGFSDDEIIIEALICEEYFRKRTCPNCSSIIPTGMITCPKCTALPEKTCPKCGSVIPIGMTSCPKCTVLPEKTCPKCGSVIPIGMTSCPKCKEFPERTCPNCGTIIPTGMNLCPKCTEDMEKVELPFTTIPKGKVATFLGVLNYLQTQFDELEIAIKASKGSITKDDYEDKIMEALKQSGIELKHKQTRTNKPDQD